METSSEKYTAIANNNSEQTSQPSREERLTDLENNLDMYISGQGNEFVSNLQSTSNTQEAWTDKAVDELVLMIIEELEKNQPEIVGSAKYLPDVEYIKNTVDRVVQLLQNSEIRIKNAENEKLLMTTVINLRQGVRLMEVILEGNAVTQREESVAGSSLGALRIKKEQDRMQDEESSGNQIKDGFELTKVPINKSSTKVEKMRKGIRQNRSFNEKQQLVLKRRYIENRHPGYVTIDEIALEIGAERARVAKWFNNRRYRARRREDQAKRKED